jgi:hypothetical protein
MSFSGNYVIYYIEHLAIGMMLVSHSFAVSATSQHYFAFTSNQHQPLTS